MVLWCKNDNSDAWTYPANNTYHPSKEILELRERAKKLKSITVVDEKS